MTENKLEKPENMADSKTYKAMPLIEPPLECGDIFIDGEPIEEVIKTNDDGKVTGLDVDRLETMTNSDGSVTFYADKLYEVNPQTGEKVEITPPDDDSDSYVQEYPDYFIFTNKKTGKETKVDK